jgi:hypothetical protein
MLLFDVYRDGAAAKAINLDGAHLLGQECVPVRAEITVEDGRIRCSKRAAGAAALALLWDAGSAGRLMLPTTRLPERKEPYILNVELARGRLMSLLQKREDWGLFDYPSGAELTAGLDQARKMFVLALKAMADDPAAAASFADQCLAETINLSEKTALFHADIFLKRRRKNRGFSRPTFGCVADLLSRSDAYEARLADAFDFVSLPMPW